MKIIGVSGTIVGSKTSILVHALINEVKKLEPEADVEVLDLKNYDLQFCDGRPINDYTGDTKTVIEKMMKADAYIFGTPIFQGSFSGAFKNLIDLVPPEEFNGKIMGFVAAGGNHRHYLVVENQLKPLSGYLNGYAVPTVVFAHNSQFNDRNEIVDQELIKDIKKFSTQFCLMCKHLNQSRVY